jgi:arginyl-tRNA synthetase
LKDRDLSGEEKKKISEIVGVSALKYSILKSSLGSDIVYDFDKSISFEGDSGPYLQYTAVRANSILEKSKEFKIEKGEIPEEITDLEKLIYQFPEIVGHSYETLEPHHITTYLTELASAFNYFYGNTKILEDGNKYMSYQLELVKAFYQTMKNGLWLLGIEVPERM